MTFTPTEHEVAARRARDAAYHPRTHPASWVPSVNEVVPPWGDAHDSAPIVWSLMVNDLGHPTFPAWMPAHQRAMYADHAPGTFWSDLARREREAAMPESCRAINAKADAMASHG